MRIAVIADTHDKLPDAVAADLAVADEIWHLGDVKDPGIIDRLRELGCPVVVVRGNQDAGELWPMEVTLERVGRRFRLIHIPPRNLGGVEFLLHGHTHVPRDETIGGTRILNPGSVGKPNKGAPASYAWLEVTERGVAWDVRLV